MGHRFILQEDPLILNDKKGTWRGALFQVTRWLITSKEIARKKHKAAIRPFRLTRQACRDVLPAVLPFFSIGCSQCSSSSVLMLGILNFRISELFFFQLSISSANRVIQHQSPAVPLFPVSQTLNDICHSLSQNCKALMD